MKVLLAIFVLVEGKSDLKLEQETQPNLGFYSEDQRLSEALAEMTNYLDDSSIPINNNLKNMANKLEKELMSKVKQCNES